MRTGTPGRLLAVLVAFALVGGLYARSEQESARPPSQVLVVQKYALLVGINSYKYPERVPPLAGAVNDVEDIRHLLIEKFQFRPENIFVLTDSQATHAAIISSIQTRLIAKAHAGDIVVFHYSGHGSQMKDVTGTMIGGLDETIVPYDSRDPGHEVFDISGAELHPLLEQLAGKTRNLTFIFDSCHAGTLVRGARSRGIAADERTPPPFTPSLFTPTRSAIGAQERDKAAYAFIAAASSKELAFEYFGEGKLHGALTYFLTRQMRAASGIVTYRDIMDGVRGSVGTNYPSQHPSLEGVEADQQIFGGQVIPTGNYVGAAPLALDRGRVTLNTGQMDGATVGSVYEIYPPGSKLFAPPEKVAARVQVVAVEAFTSVAAIVSGGGIVSSSRAVEREHRYGDLRLRLCIEGPRDSTALTTVRAALQPVKYLSIVAEATLCNLQLRQENGHITITAADSTLLSPPIAIDDTTLLERVSAQLKAWARWFNVASISNSGTDIHIEFKVEGAKSRTPIVPNAAPDISVLAGTFVETELINYSGRDIYVAMLDLSGDGTISVLYPAQQGAYEVLKPNVPLNRSFKVFVPPGRSQVMDIVKVFASYKPIDLSPVTQERIRGFDNADSESEWLQQLVMVTSDGERGLSLESNRPVALDSWTTTQRVVLVRGSK